MSHEMIIQPIYATPPPKRNPVRSKGGRGLAFWKNPDIIEALKRAFAIDCNIKEACFYAGISRQQYYEYKKKNPDTVAEWENQRLWLSMKAKYNIAQAIYAGDIKSAWRYLETHDENYKKACQHHVYFQSKENTTVIDELTPEQDETVQYGLKLLKRNYKKWKKTR